MLHGGDFQRNEPGFSNGFELELSGVTFARLRQGRLPQRLPGEEGMALEIVGDVR